MGLLGTTLSDDEPMLHKNFLDFLRKAKEYDFSINILSNLPQMNDEIIAEIKANRLSAYRFHSIARRTKSTIRLQNSPARLTKPVTPFSA
jgi:hypothetical protein